MKKNERISAFVAEIAGTAAGSWPAEYLGYFTCFNAGKYYEAHDVLEHLWLACQDANALFYKGLIQIAGAFVHLRKQHDHPTHPKHGRRLRPAVRLFELGLKNVEPFGAQHMGLNVAKLCTLCRWYAREIEAHGFERNPWHPEQAPSLHLAVDP